MAIDDDFDIPETGAVFTFGKSRFADNAPSKFWIKNDVITKVSCGDEHTSVITETGRIFMIGSNDMGQLGLGNTNPVNKPSCVKALKPDRAVQVACGRSHTIAACESGAVYAWGHNGDGQLGTGVLGDSYHPSLVLQLDQPALAVAAGSTHSILLTSNGELYVWGSNDVGQLGLDVDVQLVPMLMTLNEPIVAVEAGYYHTLALTDVTHWYVWGRNDFGQQGLDADVQLGPVLKTLKEPVFAVVAGYYQLLLLDESSANNYCGVSGMTKFGHAGG
ncbi:unnamed protein product, partial [Meganyctiphanes norvegica]